MKTHYLDEKWVPDYNERTIFGGPSLKKVLVNLCASRATDSTTNKHLVTCKACLKKLHVV